MYLPLVLPILYLSADGGFRRATLGMRIFRLQFSRSNGADVTISRCLLRLLVGYLLLPIGYISPLCCLWDPLNRTLVDLLFDTVVGKEPQIRGFDVLIENVPNNP